MNKLSTSSKKKLATCHPLLQALVAKVLHWVDVGVTAGERGEKTQNALFVAGNSQLRYPDSKHNTSPSIAVDLVIYHPKFGYLYGGDEQLLYIRRVTGCTVAHARCWIMMQYAELNTLMQLEARKQGYQLRWGGDWGKPDGFLTTKLVDVFHWEIANASNYAKSV